MAERKKERKKERQYWGTRGENKLELRWKKNERKKIWNKWEENIWRMKEWKLWWKR